MAKVQQIQIKKAVYDYTMSKTPSPEVSRELVKFLQDPSTCDSVYEWVMERGQSDKAKKSPAIVVYSIQLLKAYLPQYIPSKDALQGLKVFLSELPTYVPQGKLRMAVTRTANQLKELIERHNQGRTFGTITRKMRDDARGKEAPRTPKRPPLQRLKSVMTINPKQLIANLITLRHGDADLQDSPPLASSFLHTHLFGAHLKKHKNKRSGLTELDLADILKLEETVDIRAAANTIGMQKKKDELMRYKSSGQLTAFRKGLHLFQYKFYAEQEKLELGFEDMDLVVSSVVNPEDGPERDDTRIMASKVLIKLLMDIYNSEDPEDSGQILSIFFEMLNAEKMDTRVHAFNLLVNMAVHSNLFEETQFNTLFDDENKGVSERMQMIQDDLFAKVCELCVYLLHNDEKEEKVWSVALTTMLFFVSNNGRINRTRMLQLDPRLIPAFLARVTNMDDRVSRVLRRMMVNLIYTESGAFDVSVLEKLGGINTVIDNYVRTRSIESQNNLFVVLFDYALHEYTHVHGNAEPPHQQVALILEILKRYHAPGVFSQIFKELPDKFTNQIIKFVLFEQIKQDPALQQLAAQAGKLDKSLMLKLLHEIEKVATQYGRLDLSLQATLGGMLKGADPTEGLLQMGQLVRSDDEQDRRNGGLFMFHLLREGQRRSSATAAQLLPKVEKLFTEMTNDPSPKVRFVYLQVLERLLLWQKSTLPSHSLVEAHYQDLFRIMNRHMSRLVMVHEKEQQNLRYMFDILLDTMGVEMVDAASDPYELRVNDTLYQQFLAGKYIVPLYILRYINLSMFYHLFISLSPRTSSDQRVMLFVLIVEKCKTNPSLYESIGGNKRFKELLGDRDSRVSYFAASYLMDRFRSEKPDQYQAFLNVMHEQAQETGDRRILTNPYLQVRAMLNAGMQ